MSNGTAEGTFVMFLIMCAALITNQCTAKVTPEQYSNATAACEDAQGLASYAAWRTGLDNTAHDIVCKDGRTIDQWPPDRERQVRWVVKEEIPDE